jgi:ABC-type multidrug transport system fused ATPase/permease subunit
LKVRIRSSKRLRPKAIARIVRHFAPHLRRYRPQLAAAAACMLGATVVELLRPWPLKLVFDWILVPQDSRPTLLLKMPWLANDPQLLLGLIVLSILLIAALAGVLRFGQKFLTASVGQRVVASIRYDLYSHIQRLSHSFHDSSHLGDLLARLTGDIRMMRELMVNSVIYISDRSLMLVGLLGMMLWMDWQLALVALIAVPLLALTVTRFTKDIRGAIRRQRNKESTVTNVLSEKISSIKVVQAFAREAYEEERFEQSNQSSMKAGLAALRLEGLLSRIVEVILAVGTGGVVWLGVARVQAGSLTPGDLLVFTAYLSSLYKPIRRLAALTSRITKATVSGERIVSILEIKPDVQDAPDAVEAPPFKGSIEFRNVSFGYVEGAPLLQHVCFAIEPGETVALVGKSGSGKSTIADLLLRLYDPSDGEVRIDGTDIRRFTQASLREQIGVVLQESVLFDASIRENIGYGQLDATEDEIVAAARLANAHDFIQELPEGYDTVVGERGAKLSGGERQRIAIARAFIRNAPILVLDEPMSSLDVASETKVQEALTDLIGGKTCLYITHDLGAAALADSVLAVRRGRILEIEADGVSAALADTLDERAAASAAAPCGPGARLEQS